ncbi:MAG TPA: sugar transferase [Terracidiphilus sp.]|jgi:lipopolysaccharide/colanic/teichoic acid biosynthesis glycosyltransferase|nr:sugar transferase [Terracidiphilus sp.]
MAIQPWIIQSFQPPGQTVPIQSLPAEIPPASRWCLSRSKRAVDLLIALAVLALLAFPMLVIAICVCLTSKGSAFFLQKRVGRGGHLFRIYKFRSMTPGSGAGPGHTRGGDQRITAFGRLLRKFKLDELPQFYNVLRGDMSLVGPRPKLPHHEPIPDMPYRPGITGAASLAFRHEEHILSGVHANQLDHFYDNQIKPLKTHLDLHYMSQATLWTDVRMMAATFLVCLAPAVDTNFLIAAEEPAGNDSMTA